jgi:PAS domain S-box-containing protein
MADRIRVLYVDDEPSLLEIAKMFLENDGEFCVETADSARKALDSLSIPSYDVVLSDFQMPGMDGIAFLKAVRERFGDVPFILFTGRGREEIVIDAINNGVDFYLQKGGDVEAQFAELAHKIRQVVARKRTEIALRESEKRLRLLIQEAPWALAMFDREMRYIVASRRWIADFHLGDREILGHSHYEIFPEIPEELKVIHRRSLAGEVLSADEDKFIRQDGSVQWLSWEARPWYEIGNAIGGIIIYSEEISKQKKAEEAVRQSEEKFRSIFENSPYPIAINSLPDNKFLEVNKAFLDISGYTPTEILGKDPMEMGFLPLTEALRLISHRVLTGKIENVPLAVTAKGGKRVHVLFSTMPVIIHDKPALVTVTAEVTKLKRIEEELLQKNEDLNAAYEELTTTEEELRQNYEELSNKEEVLRESEEKFRVLVELSLDGIIITDFLGKLLFANQAAGLIVDAPDYEAMIGNKNVMDFVAPGFKVDVLRDLGKVELGIDAYLVNYKLITVKDREVWVECIGKKIPFGNSSAILISMRDVTERKLAEEQMRESENKFSTVFRSSPVSLTLVSATDGKFVDANDAFLKNTGYTRSEVIGRTAEDVGIFTDKREYEGFVSALRKQRTVQSMEMKCRIKNGEIRTCRFSSGIIMMDAKPHILSTVDDITEQKANGLALQALVRSMVGTTGLDSLKKITENVSSWLGADCVMVGEIQPDQQTVNVLSMLLDGKEVRDFSYMLKGTPCENVADKGFCLYPDNAIALFPESKDLDELKIQGYVGTPLRNSGGHVIGILCALSRNILLPTPSIQEIMDIIAVKAAAEIERIKISRALLDSEQLLREVFDNANDAVFLVERARNGPGKYRLVNNTAVQMLGYSKEELLEMSPRDNVPEDIAQTIIPEVMEKLINEGQATFESVNRRKDGSIIPVEVSIRSFRYKGTDIDLSIVRDITERKRDVEALRQANKKLNLLSDITRHDIKNQLLTLDGFVALLHKKIPDPSYESYFSRIRIASNQITNMIQFTKEYEQIGVHAPTWQDIRNLVDTAVGYVSLDQVTLKNDLPASTEVFADPLIVRVIFNLVDNAVRHGGKIATIRFSLEERDGNQIIVCEDDGDGVPMAEKEIIFNLGLGKNTGFGLAISREILDITGITITENGEPGKGARFEIAVPKNQYRVVS